MSPNLRIDPDAVRSLARTIERTADDTTGISATIGTAQQESALSANGTVRLQTIRENLSLVARMLVLRAQLAETFSLDPTHFRLAEELRMVEVELANRLAAPAEAQVARIVAALDAVGPLAPDDLLDRDRLDEVSAHEPEVAAALREIVAHRDDPAYLHDVFARLGPERLHQLMTLTNAFGYAHDVGRLHRDPFTEVLQPLAASLGAAQRARALPPAVEAALLDFGPGDPADPRFERLSVREYDEASAVLEIRRRVLALLLQEGDVTSTFRARAVAEIVRTPPSVGMYSHEGFQGRDTALTELVALRSLTRDDQAMYEFVTLDADGDGWYENAALLTQIGQFNDYAVNDAAAWTGDPKVIRDELATVSSTILERGLLAVPAGNGTAYGRAELGAFSTVVIAAGYGDVDDRLKRTVAVVSSPYARDLAVAYDPTQSLVLKGDSRLVDVDHEQVVRFMKELSYDQDALARMAANGTAFMITTMQTQIPHFVDDHPNAFTSEALGAGTYFAALGDGVNESNIDKTEAREAIVNGMRMVSDPLLGLAVGKLPLAKLPVVSGVADKATDSLSDAVYGKLVPMPELEDLAVWHSSVTTQAENAIVDMAWNDPALRVRFGGPDEAALTDLRRADPAIVDAVYQRFLANDDLVDVVAGMRIAIDSAIVTNKEFEWNR